MNNTLPIVSVAIISYNQQDFIEEALESVLTQSYQNFEIIVGDDASTDGTKEILIKYQSDFPDKIFTIFADKNEGITINANKVHQQCKGKYIAWMGGDDLMLPSKLEKQVLFMETHPTCNLLYHNLEVFESETGKVLQLYNLPKDKHRGSVEKLIKYGTFNGACSTMLRHSASPPYGHDESLLVASDWLYWIDHLIHGGTIEYIDEILGKYRRHSRNVSSENSPFLQQGIKDTFNTLNIINEKYPQYWKAVKFRRSEIYRTTRHKDYRNVWLSLKYNPFNISSWIISTVYILSFKKIKL